MSTQHQNGILSGGGADHAIQTIPGSARNVAVRRAVPFVVGGMIAAAILVPTALANASGSGLADITAEELVAQIAEAEPQPLSGTAVYTARLGLLGIPVSDVYPADPLLLLDGSSTIRVWTDGAERSRASLLGSASEYSVVHDGPEAWTYSSTYDETVHYVLGPDEQAKYDEALAEYESGSLPVPGEIPTPQDATKQLLAELGAYSTVDVDDQVTIAGRGAYTLVVTPTSAITLVDRVEIAVDAETSTPLQLRIWSTLDAAAPAWELGFTDISFAAPSDAVLAFATPSGSQYRQVEVALPAGVELPDVPGAELPDGVAVTGEGWESVVEISGLDVPGLLAADPQALVTLPDGALAFGSAGAQDLIEEFLPQDASGSPALSGLDSSILLEQLAEEVPEGRLITTKLGTVLITEDGRVLFGAVPADVLRGEA